MDKAKKYAKTSRGGKVMKKAEGGKVANPNRFPTMPTPATPIKRPGAPSANLGSGGGSRPSINPALIENKPPRGGSINSPIGRPNTARPMPSNPMDRGAVSRMKKGGMANKPKGKGMAIMIAIGKSKGRGK